MWRQVYTRDNVVCVRPDTNMVIIVLQKFIDIYFLPRSIGDINCADTMYTHEKVPLLLDRIWSLLL